MSALSQAPRSMRESCSWEGNTYAKYIDESSARPSGSMEVLDVVWFAHNCKGGQYSSAKVHRSVSVDADGTVNVDDASIPGLRYEVIEGR